MRYDMFHVKCARARYRRCAVMIMAACNAQGNGSVYDTDNIRSESSKRSGVTAVIARVQWCKSQNRQRAWYRFVTIEERVTICRSARGVKNVQWGIAVTQMRCKVCVR